MQVMPALYSYIVNDPVNKQTAKVLYTVPLNITVTQYRVSVDQDGLPLLAQHLRNVDVVIILY